MKLIMIMLVVIVTVSYSISKTIDNNSNETNAIIRHIEYILKNLGIQYHKEKPILQTPFYTLDLTKIYDYDHLIPDKDVIYDSLNPNILTIPTINSLFGVELYVMISGYTYRSLLKKGIFQVTLSNIAFTKTENDQLKFNDFDSITLTPDEAIDLIQLNYFNEFRTEAVEEIKKEISALMKQQLNIVYVAINQLIADTDSAIQMTQNYYDMNELNIILSFLRIISNIQIVEFSFKPEMINIINQDEIVINRLPFNLVYNYSFLNEYYSANIEYESVIINRKTKEVSYVKSSWVIDPNEKYPKEVGKALNEEVFNRLKSILNSFFT